MNSLEKTYTWLLIVINSVNHSDQIPTCRTLVENFEKRYKDEPNVKILVKALFNAIDAQANASFKPSEE